MKQLRLKRNQNRATLTGLGILVALLIAFNFWFRYHAETAVEALVAAQSNGNVGLKLKKFKFNWVNNKMELLDAVFYTKDSSNHTQTELSSPKITIRALGFLPLLLKKQILIDSVHLYQPKVLITKYPSKDLRQVVDYQKDTVTKAGSFSIGRELGKIANTINRAIDVLKIDRFVVENGIFSIEDKGAKDQRPFTVDKIQIHLDHLQVDDATRSKSKRQIAFADDIAVQATGQNLIFPGGRHFLSFRNFRISQRDQRITFDSCMVRGIKGDSSKSAFKVHFDKLELAKINFDTLYAADVIMADSALCKNPKITLEVDADQPVRKKGDKKIQNIDDLVEQLLGDLLINHVLVKNAAVSISSIKNHKINTYGSSNINFELQGLKVLQNHQKPVTVDKLLMNLQDYETRLENGRYFIAFDSIRYENNALTLNQFTFKETDKNKLQKSLKMPGFEIRGLSWESLLYDNSFNARSARLYRPDIEIDATPQPNRRAKNLFGVLQDINRILNLPHLTVQNGHIKLKLGNNAFLKLENSDFSILADQFIESKKINTLVNAFKQAIVDKVTYTKGALRITAHQVSLSQNNQGLNASQLSLLANGLNLDLSNIHLDDVPIDSLNKEIILNGLSWENGALKLDQSTGGGGNLANIPPLTIRNIKGGPTSVLINGGKHNFSAQLNSLRLSKLVQPQIGFPSLEGFYLSGKDINWQQTGQKLSIGQLLLTDKSNSNGRGLIFSKTNETDSIFIEVPGIDFNTDIEQLLKGHFNFRALQLFNPKITAVFGGQNLGARPLAAPQPAISIETALLQKPEIHLTLINKDNLPGYLQWNSKLDSSQVRLTGFTSTSNAPVAAKQVDVFLTDFDYYSPRGKHLSTDDNRLNLRFEKVLVQKNKDNKVEWETVANILSLDKLDFDSLGKRYGELRFNSGSVHNIRLHSNSIGNILQIIQNSKDLKLLGSVGQFTSTFHKLAWHNFSFQNAFFNADSVVFTPLQSIEEYKTKRAFPQDYLTINSGLVSGGPVDLQKLTADSALVLSRLDLNQPNIFTFKDKRHHDKLHIIKPLPVAQILQIPVKLAIDTLRFQNMHAEYWEINPKTHQIGRVPVSDISGSIHNIRNYNLHNGDSLYAEATGRVIHELLLHLEMNQSYQDSSGAFVMKLQTGPVNFKQFNTVLVPLEAIEILNGQLDSMKLEATGNNNYASGLMRMYYQNLKLKVLDKNELKKQLFSNKFLSWVANTFVLKKQSRGKPAAVFFERHKNRSVFNFLIKTTLSGIKSSAGLPGVKSNQKKYLHQQNRQQTR